MVCKKCGKYVAEGLFCDRCGSRLDEPAGMVCPTCGARCEAGTDFCGECGARLGGGAVPPVVNAAPGAIICPSCGARCEAGTDFCGECGARLGGESAPVPPVVSTAPGAVICPTCGAMCEPGTDFCGECGARLGGGAVSPETTYTKVETEPAHVPETKIKINMGGGEVVDEKTAAMREEGKKFWRKSGEIE